MLTVNKSIVRPLPVRVGCGESAVTSSRIGERNLQGPHQLEGVGSCFEDKMSSRKVVHETPLSVHVLYCSRI